MPMHSVQNQRGSSQRDPVPPTHKRAGARSSHRNSRETPDPDSWGLRLQRAWLRSGLLVGTAVQVLAALCVTIGPDYLARARLRDLARLGGLSREQARRTIHKLETQGVLERLQRGSKSQPNVWRVTDPPATPE